MPSLWKRMEQMLTANSHARLDQLENPAHMSQQILRDLDDELDGLRKQLLASVSRERKINASLGVLCKQSEAHDQRARQALSDGNEANARHHLNLKLKLEREIEQLQQLCQQQSCWTTSLREERAHLLREREELGSQARVISLRKALQMDGTDVSGDLYSKSVRRRERMARYSEQVDGGLDELISAQALRAEELGQAQASDDLALEDALSALKRDLDQENAA